MIITKMALPRRTFLRGVGATLALPYLDAMVPALSAAPKAALRFSATYIGNGASMGYWTPPTEGANFEFSSSLSPLEPFRQQTLVLSDLDNFPGTDMGDTGGQHPRAAVAFMSGAHAKQTEGADLRAGTTIDQLVAETLCRDLKVSSLELGLDRNDVVGACDHGYACAYMNSLAWKTPTLPLPAELNPRFVFERLFGNGDTSEERVVRSREDRSLLDGVAEQITQLRRRLGVKDTAQLSEYFDAIRDIEQRIAKVESYNSDLPVPERPAGVPATFREHAELMFDLQVLAFQADITRVSSFMFARENTYRAYPEIGLPEEHHAMSHHKNIPENLTKYAKLNKYHVDAFANFVKKLQSITDGDGTLLDHSVLLYGGGMSDANVHNNFKIPVIVVGGHDLGIKGNRHLRLPSGTPLANLGMTLLDRLNVPVKTFGNSTGMLDI